MTLAGGRDSPRHDAVSSPAGPRRTRSRTGTAQGSPRKVEQAWPLLYSDTILLVKEIPRIRGLWTAQESRLAARLGPTADGRPLEIEESSVPARDSLSEEQERADKG